MLREPIKNSNHDPYPPSPDRPFLPCRRQRQGRHFIRDAAGKDYLDAVERRSGVLSGALASRRAGGNARAARQARLCAYELLHDAGGRGAGRRSHRPRARRASVTCSSSAAGRRRLRRRSSSRASISSSAASRSGDTSSRGGKAITASRSARLRSEAGVAAQPVRSAADRDASRIAGLRVSRAGAGRDPASYGVRLARELEAKIAEVGGDSVMAFVAETVVGATLGAVPAVPTISSACARSAIATAFCSFSMK